MATTPPPPPLTGTLIGYARVSSAEQSLDLQHDALTTAGCIQIFQDKISGAKADRPGLDQTLAYLRSGDTLVVWRLDRLGRSLKHLIQTVEALQDRGVGFRSLQEAIDTTTSGGRLVFQIFGALAEFERSLIQERTMAGLEAARARGRKGGRKRKLSEDQQRLLIKLYESKEHSVREICALLGISRSALYGYIKQNNR